ncbi:MAG: lysophospholipid acyltransferase family protein [Candidatus Binatia bacterium]
MAAWLTRRVFYLTTWFGIAISSLAVRLLPRIWLFRFSDFIASVGFVCFKGFRTRSIGNIAAVFGEQLNGAQVEEIARRSLRNFFRDCTEMAIVLEMSDSELREFIPMVGHEHLDAALAKGSGVLALSAHLGNFFLIGTRLAVDGYAVSVLVNQPSDSHLAKLMDKYRLQVRQKTIHARPRREALNQLTEALRRNELAVIISDEYRRGDGIEVPLFGRIVIARRGPATVALRTGAAIVPAYMIRQPDGTLKLIIERELELDRSGKGAEQIRENTIRLTHWVERTVREYPDQWNWMNIRWWTAPPGSEPGAHAPVRQAS